MVSVVAEQTVQGYEVVAWLIILLGYLPMIVLYLRERALLVFSGYTALLVGSTATLLESVAVPAVFNAVEHVVGILGASTLFLASAIAAHQQLYAVTHPDTPEGSA